MCCLDHPQVMPSVEAVADSTWWPDFVQGCRDPDHTLLGAESYSHVVVRVKH
jgi:hypothetical protein